MTGAGAASFAEPHGHHRMARRPSTASLLLSARGLRAFADGFVALLLPVYLTRLGFDPLDIGILTTATLLGSAVLTLAVGLMAHRLAPRRLLLAAALLMLATGISFALFGDFWPLVVIGFVGTLNPSAGDVSLFLPLEQSLLAHDVADDKRTALFARYSLVGSLVGALGSLAAGLPELASAVLPLDATAALQAMFVLRSASRAASSSPLPPCSASIRSAAASSSSRCSPSGCSTISACRSPRRRASSSGRAC